MKQVTINNSQSGMALVTVIIFTVIGLIVITLGITLSISTSQTNLHSMQAQQAFHIAEAGVENALIRLLRNPYYQGEVLTLNNGTATIELNNEGSNQIVVVVGEHQTIIRKIEVQLSEHNGIMRIESWKEMF